MSDPGSDPSYPFGFDLGPHPRTLQLIWFSFLIVGQAGLALFLLTLFFSKSLAPRLPVFYNFVLLSFFGTPVYLILFYTGEFMNTRPPYAQCLVQAVMKHGIDPAFILSSLLLVIETWKSLVRGPRERTHSPSRGWIMLALPYLNFLLFAIPAALIGLYFPDEVSHGGHSFFCTIVNDTFGAILSLEVALIAIGTLICQVAIWTVLWKRRKVTRTMGVPSSLDTSQIVRISFFNVWETIGLLLNSGAIVNTLGNTLIASTFLAIIPLSVFLVFASQKDILRIWFPFFFRLPDYRLSRKPVINVVPDGSSTDELPKSLDMATEISFDVSTNSNQTSTVVDRLEDGGVGSSRKYIL